MNAIFTSNLVQNPFAAGIFAFSSAFASLSSTVINKLDEGVVSTSNLSLTKPSSLKFDAQSLAKVTSDQIHSSKFLAKERLLQQIDNYRFTPLLNGYVSQDELISAIEFAKKLPGSIVMPKLMVNDNARIGFYWDMKDVYVDVDVESENKISLYFKKSSGVKGLIDDVDVGSIDTSWINDNLSKLFYS